MFQEKLLKEALRRYAGSVVVERVLRMGEAALEAGVTERDMTVMWVEPIASRLRLAQVSPRERYQAIVAFWSVAMAVVDRNDGLVDSYYGDSFLAYFGLRDGVDHAALATVCAQRIVEATWNIGPAEPLYVARIGIDTGRVRHGNIGTPGRIKFTVMGEPVNLASRLALRAANHGPQVLLSEAVIQSANPAAMPPVEPFAEADVAGTGKLSSIFALSMGLDSNDARR